MTDPKNINEIMAEFTDENDVLDMEAFLAAASDPEHPGHRFFLWHNADADNAYRQAQVARLINSVFEETDDDEAS